MMGVDILNHANSMQQAPHGVRHTCAEKPPCLNTSHEAMPMPVYRALHTGANTAFGGIHDGFFSFEYLKHICLILRGHGRDSVHSNGHEALRTCTCGVTHNAPIPDRRFSQHGQSKAYA